MAGQRIKNPKTGQIMAVLVKSKLGVAGHPSSVGCPYCSRTNSWTGYQWLVHHNTAGPSICKHLVAVKVFPAKKYAVWAFDTAGHDTKSNYHLKFPYLGE